MIFPDRPYCHDSEISAVHRFPEHLVWRAPDLLRQPSASPFRTCGYCGSMHPEDLHSALVAGATLHGCDWKYGWPHKFYVEGIPNPLAGQQVEIGSRSYPILACPVCHHRPDPNVFPAPPICGGCGLALSRRDYTVVEYRDEKTIGAAPAHAFAKFYNAHLGDLTDPDTFKAVADAIRATSKIEFVLNEGGLKYRAPYAGFQA